MHPATLKSFVWVASPSAPPLPPPMLCFNTLHVYTSREQFESEHEFDDRLKQSVDIRPSATAFCDR